MPALASPRSGRYGGAPACRASRKLRPRRAIAPPRPIQAKGCAAPLPAVIFLSGQQLYAPSGVLAIGVRSEEEGRRRALLMPRTNAADTKPLRLLRLRRRGR